MEHITKGFDDLVNNNLRIENKYVLGAVSLCLILYSFMAAPKLPEYIAKLFDHTLFKLLILFLILFITLKFDPSTSLIVAVGVSVIILTLNLMKHKENMAEVSDNNMKSIPEFVPSVCGTSKCPHDVANAYRGEHGEIIGERDGPISGVSEDDVKSLCMHLETRDENATKEIMTPSNFSELVNAEQACNFASHQYNIPSVNVPCGDPKNVQGKEVEFSELAPIS